MAESSIPVDLFNPGQVFACIGFVEAADVLLGDAEGAFDWRDASDVRFRIRARGTDAPIDRIMRFLALADVVTEAPAGSPSLNDWLDSWGPRPCEVSRERGYSSPDLLKPAKLACVLRDDTHALRLQHWGDAKIRDDVKFWAGAGGYPGSALARDALDLARPYLHAAAHDPFSVSAPQSSSFRLDWRRDYVPIDLGFSLNKHNGRIQAVGYPIVELLAALGLTDARPKRPDRRNKFVYEYSALGTKIKQGNEAWFPLPLLRASLGTAPLPFPIRTFRMFLNSPGKDDRAITTVTEVISP